MGVGEFHNVITSLTEPGLIPRHADLIAEIWSDHIFEIVVDKTMTIFTGTKMTETLPIIAATYSEFKIIPSGSPVFIKWQDIENLQQRGVIARSEHKWNNNWVIRHGSMERMFNQGYTSQSSELEELRKRVETMEKMMKQFEGTFTVN